MTFVKQYGLERTGTNATRALLEGRFDDVCVLMHVLGDKHSPPVDWTREARAASGRRDAAYAFVLAASLAAPAESTRLPYDAEQRRYAEAIAPEVYDEVCAGRVRVVVNVRAPHDWVLSMLRWKLLLPAESAGAREGLIPTVVAMCERYNHATSAWLELTRRTVGAAVVRHEDLTGPLDPLVARLGRDLRLTGRPREGALLPFTLAEADWDQMPTPVYPQLYEQRCARKSKGPSLPAELLEVVDEEVDWHPLCRFGYFPF